MAKFRLKNSFSAGELSPLMAGRTDFKRYANGCTKLQNMLVTTQGPVTRRPGFEFISDLDSLQISTGSEVRLVPFIFNEQQSYMLLFYRKVPDDNVFVVIIYDDKILTDADAIPEGSPTLITDGSEEYTIFNPDAKVITVFELEASDNSETLLVLNTDYTITNSAGSPDYVLSVNMSPLRFANLRVYLNKTVGNAVLKLTLPVNFDIKLFDYAQSGDVLFIAQPKLQPWEIRRNGHVDWTEQAQAISGSPGDPGRPLWSDSNGWPEAVTFHQQRLVYGGHRVRRQTLWFSGAGSFDNFTTDSTIPVKVDAPLVLTLDSGTQNAIQWLVSLKSLNVGTIGDEWTITGSNRDAIVPGGVIAHRQTNNGSEKIKPQVVGITILFIERFGRTINEFVYDFNTDSYKTSDISILSKHVTRKASIIDWAYQQTPDSIFWSIRDDGVLLGTTYQREHEVVGWSVHDTGADSGDEFRAIGVIPGLAREDSVYAIVKRANTLVDGSSLILEKMHATFEGESTTHSRFLDSAILFKSSDFPTPAVELLTGHDVIELGVYHLIGRTVTILRDGVEQPTQVVDDIGEITVENGFTEVYVGLAYSSEVWPTLKDEATQNGTSKGRTNRLTHLEIDVFETRDFKCGRWSHESGEKAEEVIADPHHEAEDSVFDGLVHYEFPEGFDRNSSYFLRQDKPYPLTVRSVTDVYEVSK